MTKTKQTTLGNDPTDEGTTDTTNPTARNTDEQESPSTTTDAIFVPPAQHDVKQCCPWCLAAAETFVHHEDGRVGCGHCDAVIPVGVKWYERGEKIVI